MIFDGIFAGKYKLLKVLGEGGMGKVYLAENISLGTFWAVKQISKSGNEEINLLAEPNILKKLNHPALPRIFDIHEDYHNIYIVEDFIEGVPIDKKLEEVGKFDEETIVDWAKQLCDALKYLHNMKPNPVIHRDMKPSNLIANDDNVIKIIDFGIAREHKQGLDSDTTYMGTMGYAAPEQWGTAQSDARTDIYSLGITLYHMITGKGPNDPPFEILPVRQLNPNLSKGIEYIIKKCTQQDPEKRYQSVEELLYDLENIHKFDIAYKKRRVKSFIASIAFIIFISGFSFLTYSGFNQLEIEKNEEYDTLVLEGKSLADDMKYNIALETFNNAIEKIPDRTEAYEEIAHMYLKQEEYDTCISYIENDLFIKVPVTNENPDILYIIGTCYFEKKEYKDATIYFKRALNIVSLNVDYERDLAVSYARMGNLNEARKLLGDIQSKKIDEEVSWYVYGEILAADKEYEEALAAFEKSLNMAKDEYLKRRTFLSIAEVLKNNSNSIDNGLDRLINILERAKVDLRDKQNIAIIEMLGEAYFNKAVKTNNANDRNEYYSKSIENFENLLITYKRPYLYRNIAITYQQIGNFKKSEETLLNMKEVYPDNYECYLQLAFLYIEIENNKRNEDRDYNNAYDYYKLAVKYSPNGENTEALIPLVNLINELKSKNWLD